MVEFQSVLVRLDAMDTRITMDAGPGIYYKNLHEAAAAAEERFAGAWNCVQWYTVSLSRDEWLATRAEAQRKATIQLMRDYLTGFINGCEQNGMSATDIRDSLCVNLLG